MNAGARAPLPVFLTIDTEAWCESGSPAAYEEAHSRFVRGETAKGAYGIDYQARILNQHGLRAAFFVEALAATVFGRATLRDTVERVQAAGQKVELHLHPEWLRWAKDPPVPARSSQLGDFPEEEQTLLIRLGLEELCAAGARDVIGLRAGNYGADARTLRSARAAGLTYDTSYNACYLSSTCRLRPPTPLLGPARLEGLVELPISVFQDFPGHFRHAQLNACSFRELRAALEQAHARGFAAFVIVSHSFELLDRTRRREPDPFTIRRWEALCRYLDEHRDRFRTDCFDGTLPTEAPPDGPLVGSPLRTALRVGEQLVRRALYRG